MSDYFRLYIGYTKNSKWYNYAKCKDILGGALAVLDTADKSSVGRLLNLIKHSVEYLYTEENADGEREEYKLQDYDYEFLKLDDAWKIAMEIQKQFLDEEYPVSDEYFFCPICSHKGREIYTPVKESWHKLIQDGIIDEHYLDTEDCSFVTELPHGLVIDDSKTIANGTYTKITREPVTIGELLKILKIPEIADNESLYLSSIWDAQIKKIEGLSERDLNILKRNPKDSMTRKYLIKKNDINEMANKSIKYGIDASHRSVMCKNCHSEIGGGLDFTNFFEFIFPKRSSQNTIMSTK